MDALSKLLEHLKLSSAVYFHEEFSSPWGLRIPEGPYAQFHLLSAGSCQLSFKGENYALSAGDILIFPKGTAHKLQDSPESPGIEGKELIRLINQDAFPFSGSKMNSQLLCGHFTFDTEIEHPFLRELPEMIYLSAKDRQEHTKLKNIVELILQEADSGKAGTNLVITKLAEVLFIHCMRIYAQQHSGKKGFLVSLRNPKISTALKLIHELPEEDWTLERLSLEAGMSRTSFATTFRDLLGTTPHSYLTDWRMLVARKFLIESRDSIAMIAERVGYKSEAAFSRVFKKKTAISPSRFRLTNSSS